MATPASVLVTTALQRVRDPQGSMHSRPDVLTLLSHAQRLVNGLTHHLVTTVSLTLTPRQWVYPIAALMPTIQSVTGIRHDNRKLDRCQWRDWWVFARGFQRATADRPIVWDAIGHDCLLVWPPAGTAITVSVSGAERIADLGGEMTNLSLHESLHPMLLDVLEVLLLIRARDTAPLPAALAALQGAMARVQG